MHPWKEQRERERQTKFKYYIHFQTIFFFIHQFFHNLEKDYVSSEYFCWQGGRTPKYIRAKIYFLELEVFSLHCKIIWGILGIGRVVGHVHSWFHIKALLQGAKYPLDFWLLVKFYYGYLMQIWGSQYWKLPILKLMVEIKYCFPCEPVGTQISNINQPWNNQTWNNWYWPFLNWCRNLVHWWRHFYCLIAQLIYNKNDYLNLFRK